MASPPDSITQRPGATRSIAAQQAKQFFIRTSIAQIKEGLTSTA